MASKKEKELNLRAASAAFFLPKLKLADIKKNISMYFNKGEYKQLRNYLRACRLTKGQFAYFFLQEGHDILKWSLVNAVSDEPLKFLIETVPAPALLVVLSKNEYAIFKSFLRTQVGLEDLGWYDHEVEKIQTSKFKALLGLNKEAVTAFMEETAVVTDIALYSEHIRTNFAAALEQVAEDKLSK
jgi:hypothetical protein